MSQGISLVVYPVTEIERTKRLYARLFGAEPYVENPYYVGFRAGDVEFGLDPNAAAKGVTGPVAYWPVDDIQESINGLVAAGAQAHQGPMDVGEGKKIALLKDAAGNMIGLVQAPSTASM